MRHLRNIPYCGLTRCKWALDAQGFSEHRADDNLAVRHAYIRCEYQRIGRVELLADYRDVVIRNSVAADGPALSACR